MRLLASQGPTPGRHKLHLISTTQPRSKISSDLGIYVSLPSLHVFPSPMCPVQSLPHDMQCLQTLQLSMFLFPWTFSSRCSHSVFKLSRRPWQSGWTLPLYTPRLLPCAWDWCKDAGRWTGSQAVWASEDFGRSRLSCRTRDWEPRCLTAPLPWRFQFENSKSSPSSSVPLSQSGDQEGQEGQDMMNDVILQSTSDCHMCLFTFWNIFPLRRFRISEQILWKLARQKKKKLHDEQSKAYQRVVGTPANFAIATHDIPLKVRSDHACQAFQRLESGQNSIDAVANSHEQHRTWSG